MEGGWGVDFVCVCVCVCVRVHVRACTCMHFCVLLSLLFSSPICYRYQYIYNVLLELAVLLMYLENKPVTNFYILDTFFNLHSQQVSIICVRMANKHEKHALTSGSEHAHSQ